MARGRIIKPAFFSDVTLSECSRDARLLYIGLWGLMDCRGLMEYHPKLVKRDVLPYDDDMPAVRIAELIDELVRNGRLRIFEHEGKRYLFGRYLLRHQHFHVNEKPNKLIPEAIASLAALDLVPKAPQSEPEDAGSEADNTESEAAPEQHHTSTVQAPCEHDASTPDTDTETDTETDPEADDAIPAELDTQEIREICHRRQVSARALCVWLTKAPSPQWLIDKLQELDLEADASIAHGQKPFVVRMREYLTRHLDYEKNPRARGSPNQVKGASLEEIREWERQGSA